MRHTDYIKDGDGHTVYINRKGRELTRTFIAKNGGVSGVSKITGISRPPLINLKDNGSCAPDTWERLFVFISNQQTA